MNTFTSPRNLRNLSELKRERESKINFLINNLKLIDVKENKAFDDTTKEIKKKILLTPVTIGEPSLVDYKFEERPLTHIQKLNGGSPNHYLHNIIFIFTGSADLFQYTPESGYSFTSFDHGIIEPVANAIWIEVDLPELNPVQAITEARQLLRMNFEFIEKNNPSIIQWSSVIEKRIDEQLKQKRIELINLFGGK
jgi:hypothetical protein